MTPELALKDRKESWEDRLSRQRGPLRTGVRGWGSGCESGCGLNARAGILASERGLCSGQWRARVLDSRNCGLRVEWKLCAEARVKPRLQGPEASWWRGCSHSLGRRPQEWSKPHISPAAGNAQDSIFRASHFRLLSLSNTKNLCFHKAGAGAALSLPLKPTLRF